MPKHPDDDFMDSYLLGTMGDEARDEFEEHYFNCETCFAKMAERDRIIKILRNKGVLGALAEPDTKSAKRPSLWKRILHVFRRH